MRRSAGGVLRTKPEILIKAHICLRTHIHPPHTLPALSGPIQPRVSHPRRTLTRWIPGVLAELPGGRTRGRARGWVMITLVTGV